MPLSRHLDQLLTEKRISYDTITHPFSINSLQSAVATHIAAREVAKAVIIKQPAGNLLMTVIPADRRLHLGAVQDFFGATFQLARESELRNTFSDCKAGAFPPVGEVCQMQSIWDDQFLSVSDIYFEAGDHETLVHMSGDNFQKLQGSAPHTSISIPLL